MNCSVLNEMFIKTLDPPKTLTEGIPSNCLILVASTKSIGVIASIALLLFLSDAQSFHTRTPHSVCAHVFSGIPFILNYSNCCSLNGSPYCDKLSALSSALLFLYPAGRFIGMLRLLFRLRW